MEERSDPLSCREERLAIIADDFTGAADAGVQFAARGRPCALVTSLASLSPVTAEVVAVDVESRSLSPEAAAAAVRSAVAALRAAGFERFYKKIDSTLRGNLGAEIDALMEEAGCGLALVAPAAPRNLRTVVEGECFVAGVSLAGTEYAARSEGGEPTSSVAALIARQTRRPIASIPLDEVRRGAASLARRIEALRGEGAEIVILDAATIEDLMIAADAARSIEGGADAPPGARLSAWSALGAGSPPGSAASRGPSGAHGAGLPLLYVGSSGFAEALAAQERRSTALEGGTRPNAPTSTHPRAARKPREAHPISPAVGPRPDAQPAALHQPSPEPQEAPSPPRAGRESPVLFLIGSRSAVAQAQADTLLRTGGVFEAVVDSASAFASPAREAERIEAEVAARSERRHVLVRVAGGELVAARGAAPPAADGPPARASAATSEPGPSQGAAVPPPDRSGGEKLIASLLGELARRLLGAERFDLVAATGGDTAVAAAAALELSALRLEGEILPGVVLSTASSPRLNRTISLVTKAGGFGEPDALRRILTAWTGEVP